MTKAPAVLPVPYLFNLLADPKEETDILTENTWVIEPMNRMISDFQSSLKRYPRISAGTPDPYTPAPKSLVTRLCSGQSGCIGPMGLTPCPRFYKPSLWIPQHFLPTGC
jgi:hypothetical protein